MNQPTSEAWPAQVAGKAAVADWEAMAVGMEAQRRLHTQRGEWNLPCCAHLAVCRRVMWPAMQASSAQQSSNAAPVNVLRVNTCTAMGPGMGQHS